MEAHGQGAAMSIRKQVGRGLEHRLEELAGFLLVPFEEGSDPARQLRLGPIGDHLDGIGEQFALAFELDDLPRVEDLVEAQLFGQRLALLLETLDVVLPLPHEYVDFGLRALLLPGGSTWEPLAVAYGVVAMWMLTVVTVSFYVRKRIGQKAWRFIHYSAFGSFVAALLHGVMAGTDAGHPAALVMYVGSGVVVAVLLAARLLLAGEPRRPTRAPARPAESS